LHRFALVSKRSTLPGSASGKATTARYGYVHVRRAGLFAAAAALAVSGASILMLNHPWKMQPHLSRLQAINVALDGYPPNTFGRVEAKLVGLDNLRQVPDFRGLQAEAGVSRFWVVAISGNYGARPSFGCCSTPSGYPGKNRWGAVVVADTGGPPRVLLSEVDWHGDWPAWFDKLDDLAPKG
jgi:hypothetical protein